MPILEFTDAEAWSRHNKMTHAQLVLLGKRLFQKLVSEHYSVLSNLKYSVIVILFWGRASCISLYMQDVFSFTLTSFLSLNTKSQFLEGEIQIIAVWNMLYWEGDAGIEWSSHSWMIESAENSVICGMIGFPSCFFMPHF